MRTTDQIRVTSLNQVSCGALLWRRGGALWATVIVKATFRLVPGGIAELADPLAIVCTERKSYLGNVEAADEAVPHVPNAGVVLTGHACAPAETQTPSATVRLGLAGAGTHIDKSLYVYGTRQSAGPDAVPRPFTRMPLVYSRAVGGPADLENPVGTGSPNIFRAGDERRPPGFAAIGKSWPARWRLLGGVNPAALEGVRLTGASLAGADLTDAVLSGANLSYANLAGATLARAHLDGAKLVDANLSGALGADADFTGADLRRAKLARAKLAGVRFKTADLRAAVLDGAVLDEGALDGARGGKKRRKATQ